MKLKSLSTDLAVGPQLAVADVAELARLGFKSIVGNRPDGEEPDQPRWQDLRSAAQGNGLAARHIPVVPGEVGDAEVEAFRKALEGLPKPIAAFCRTGTRSALLWALANPAGLSPAERIEQAAEHGYDLRPYRDRLAMAQPHRG